MKHLCFTLTLLACLFTAAATQAQTSSLSTVEENGARGKRLNMVFLSEGYTEAEMGKFATDVQSAVDYMFTREPWSRYRSYFNVFRIEIASVESGTDYIQTEGSFDARSRNTYFHTGFTTQGIPQLNTLSSEGSKRAYALLNKHVPEYDIPVVLVNDLRYGGSGGPIAVATVEEFSVQVLEHELGHSFAKLTDEYDIEYPGYPSIEYPNATRKTALADIRWKQWILPDTKITRTPASELIPAPPGTGPEYDEYTPELDWWDYHFDDETGDYGVDPKLLDQTIVGLFQGANYHQVGWFRPHDNALMRNLGMPPGAVAREAILLTYYSKVSPIDDHAPSALKQTVPQRMPLTFSVVPKVPSAGPALVVTWRKDSDPTPIGTGPELTIPSEDLGNGTHTITAEIKDSTDWVRRDPTALVAETVKWTLSLSNQGIPPTIDQGPADALKTVGAEVNFTVTATAALPGALTYQWYKNGKAIAKANTAVYSIGAVKLTDGGIYSVRVTGAGGGFAQPEADLVVVDPNPQPVVLAEGKTATLIPAVAGPVSAYQWLRNDIVIPASTEGFGELNTSKLIISPVQVAKHRGRYSLTLTTAAGVATYETHLLEIFNRKPELAMATGASLEPGQIGAPYSQPILIVTLLPGAPASTFGATGLPPGLKVDPKTGIISGRPTAFKKDSAGNPIPYSVTLSAGNALGTVKVAGVNLLISPLPAGGVGTFVAPLSRHEPTVETDPSMNEGLGGRLDLTTTLNGGYSGKLFLGTKSYSFKGLLTSAVGSSTLSGSVSIPRPGLSPVDLDFTISANLQQIDGTVGAGEDTLAFSGWLNPWSKINPADDFDGYYTFRFDLVNPPAGAPTGRGFGSFTISLDGKTKITGRTADGESFTSSSHASLGGKLMIFSLQKGKPQGSVVGQFSVNDQQVIVDSESLSWWRQASLDPKARVYKDGFLAPVPMKIVGGQYQEPVAPLVVLNIEPGTSNAQLNFSGASLAEASRPPSTTVNIIAKSKASPAAALAANTTLTFNPKLGTFTGKFTLVDTNPRPIAPPLVTRSVTYYGTILQEAGNLTGDGFFLLPDLPSAEKSDTPTTSPIQSGAVKLSPLD